MSQVTNVIPITRSYWAQSCALQRSLKWLVLFLAALLPAIAQAQLSSAEKLALTARVWGLAKYRAPALANCQRNWDQDLLDVLPGVEAAGTDAVFNQRIAELIQRAGPIPSAPANSTRPAWVASSVLSEANQRDLTALANTTATGRCYVKAYFDVGLQQQFLHADFASDSRFNSAPLTRNLRLLGAFRFWNAAEYFFAYKDLIGRPWIDALQQHVLAIADASTAMTYAQAMRRFTAELNDSHGYYSSNFTGTENPPPFLAERVENKVLVTHRLPQASNVAVGDELLSVDGLPIESEITRWLDLSYGSNPKARATKALALAINGAENAVRTYGFKRPNGAMYTSALTTRAEFFVVFAGAGSSFRAVPKTASNSCSVTQINIGKLQSSELSAALNAARSSDLVVIDLRPYPDSPEVFVGLIDALLPAPTTSAFAVKTPDYANPGSYLTVPEALLSVGGNAPIGFQGRVMVLANEQSLSFSEFAAMVLQSLPRTLVVGSQTAGADGEIANGLILPGGIYTTFSSNRIDYPNGRPSQRFGIVPNIHATPTIAGVSAGRDELMELASQCRWVSETPAPRRPRSGLYYDPSRSGEGLDVHGVSSFFAGFIYSYDAQGLPIWRLSASEIQGGLWNDALNQFKPDRSFVTTGPLQMDFQMGPYAPQCAVADQTAFAGRATLAWPPQNPTRQLCLENLALSDQSRFTGLWSATAESGWGLSVHHVGQTLLVYFYAFDAAGVPRWAIGSAPWDGVSEVRIPMQRSRGFCDTCAALPIVLEAAGEITLNLKNPESSDPANLMSTNVRFHDGSVWLRNRVAMSRLQ
jgi:hypothetical protein